MFDIPYGAASELHIFAHDNMEGLQNAALLLGGQPWLTRTQRLMDELRSSPVISRRAHCEAIALHALLSLDHVHDDERPEAGYFAALDPEQPYVEEICLLADGLADAIAATVEHLKPSPQTARQFRRREV
jgi:hypothetical protein